MTRDLPIEAVLDTLDESLRRHNRAVLVAAPGAGKTTRVPLFLLDHPDLKGGRLLVLEPRRLAARGAARRMAETLGETVGETVGLRVRFETKVSARTRIEVITEGVFTRMILDDPDLSGVSAVLFDEVHERSLDTDLGLALALDAQAGLREDLRLLLMSATLDGAKAASRLQAPPPIVSQGRSFPVETLYRGRAGHERIEDAMAAAVLAALRDHEGSILAFLPGQGEIMRTLERLEGRTGPNVSLHALHGQLSPREQDEAIRAAGTRSRKVVLATAIAETSLTIEGVRIVIDSGLSRVPRHDGASGLTRLETVRVSQASADQRRGRAGRTAPGIAIRLWEEAATRALPAFDTPEILNADLTGLVLTLAQWGVSDAASLTFLDPPPVPALNSARALLQALGAIDGHGHLTDSGKAIAGIGLHPRLARMVVDAASDLKPLAAHLAALLSEPGVGGTSVDAGARLVTLLGQRGARADAVKGFARRLHAGRCTDHDRDHAGAVLALAYPDRIGKRRGPSSYRLANGRGAVLDEGTLLPEPDYLVAAELTGAGADGKLRLAAPLSLETIETLFAHAIEESHKAEVDAASRTVRARARRHYQALTLSEHPATPTPQECRSALTAFVRDKGLSILPHSPALDQFLTRARFMEEGGALQEATLLENLDDWLGPCLLTPDALKTLTAGAVLEALRAHAGYGLVAAMDRLMPSHFTAPTGRSHPIDYGAEAGPTVSLKVQELYGQKVHPVIGSRRVPLVLELLSPALRPIQVTRDLPAFFAGSWADVRKDMRGRYIRHDWPEDPFEAAPQTGTRRRKPDQP